MGPTLAILIDPISPVMSEKMACNFTDLDVHDSERSVRSRNSPGTGTHCKRIGSDAGLGLVQNLIALWYAVNQ